MDAIFAYNRGIIEKAYYFWERKAMKDGFLLVNKMERLVT